MYPTSRKMYNMVAGKILPDAIMEVSDIEHCGYSIADIHTFVIDGITIGGHTIKEEDTIRNMKRAWDRVLSVDKRYNLTAPDILRCHYDIMSDLIDDGCVGKIRDINVRISGCPNWKPVPLDQLTTTFIQECLEQIAIKDPIEQALRVYCWLTYRQFFADGNKRVARVMANSLLSARNLGFLVCYTGETNQLMDQLCSFYETEDTNKMMDYLYKRCLIHFDEQGKPIYP